MKQRKSDMLSGATQFAFAFMMTFVLAACGDDTTDTSSAGTGGEGGGTTIASTASSSSSSTASASSSVSSSSSASSSSASSTVASSSSSAGGGEGGASSVNSSASAGGEGGFGQGGAGGADVASSASAGGEGGFGDGGNGGAGGEGGDSTATSTASSVSSSSSASSSSASTSVASSSSSSGGGEGGSDTVSSSAVATVASSASSTTGGGEGGEGGGTSEPFSCGNYVRDTAFDQLRLDNMDLALVGGIWGTGSNDIYVPAGGYGNTTIFHWDGVAWDEELLPDVGQNSGQTLNTRGIWGTDDGETVYVTGKTPAVGRIFMRQNGVWIEDPNKPTAREFNGVWGADANNVFVIGWKPAGYRIWRKNGVSWTEQLLPTIPTPSGITFTSIWGVSADNVFVTGFTSSFDQLEKKGFLLHWNGSSWILVDSTPVTAKELRSVHGYANEAVFVAGISTSNQGVIYRLAGNAWEEYADIDVEQYGPVFASRSDSLVALGSNPDGAMRVTTMSPAVTGPVDNVAYGPIQIWQDPETQTMHFVSITSGGNDNAAHYTFTCN